MDPPLGVLGDFDLGPLDLGPPLSFLLGFFSTRSVLTFLVGLERVTRVEALTEIAPGMALLHARSINPLDKPRAFNQGIGRGGLILINVVTAQ